MSGHIDNYCASCKRITDHLWENDKLYCVECGSRNDARYLRIGESTLDEDKVNHPKHYTNHPSGVECIDITEHFDFLIGNVIKYAWRAGLKENISKLEDMKKMAWYANRAVEKEEKIEANKFSRK